MMQICYNSLVAQFLDRTKNAACSSTICHSNAFIGRALALGNVAALRKAQLKEAEDGG